MLLWKLFPWLFNRVELSRFSIKPAPKTGVGMRKMMLFSDTAVAKLGCGSAVALAPLPASERPVTGDRVSTPPSGEFWLTEPLLLKKNGNRASSVGPFAV